MTSPVLSVMFTALNDEIYPWQMFAEKGIMTIANNVDENTGKAGDDTERQQQEKAPEGADGNQEEIPSEDVSGNSINHTVKRRDSRSNKRLL